MAKGKMDIMYLLICQLLGNWCISDNTIKMYGVRFNKFKTTRVGLFDKEVMVW